MKQQDDGGLNRERKGTESKPCPALSAITDHTKSERQKVKNERIREDRQTKTQNSQQQAMGVFRNKGFAFACIRGCAQDDFNTKGMRDINPFDTSIELDLRSLHQWLQIRALKKNK